jgi:hypothetical protein
MKGSRIMKRISTCTFNVENLFVRYNFVPLPPGITSKKAPEADVIKGFGYLPSSFSKNNFSLYKADARALTVLALTRGKTTYPQICCLQEVESMQALRTFNEKYIDNKYPYVLLIDSHDPRLIDIGILSMFPISKIASHIDERDARRYYLFSRDCLEVTFDVNGTPLTLFVNHLKSKYSRTKKEKDNADKRRQMQAERVVEILQQRFPGTAYDSESFAVLDDFNDHPDSEILSPLLKDAGLENVIERLPKSERWTHWWGGKNLVGQLDYILLSPTLSRSSSALPVIERRGISAKRKKSYFAIAGDKKGQEIDFKFERFDGVSDEVDASDHCPVFFEVSV